MTTTEEKNWQTAWIRGGKICDLAWIGHDVLAWCCGLHIVFFDIPTNKVRLPKFTNDAASAGISCLSGHLSRRVFAFAEKNREPKIFVYAYPSLTKVSECLDGTSNAYLTTALAGDYLVSLGSMPDFKLTIWSWRSGTKIGSIDTGLHDAGNDGQTLRLSCSMPMFVAQVGNSSARLLIWAAMICSTTAIPNKNEIHLPKKALVKDVAWCPESNDLLAIADRDGHVYLTNPTGSELKRIVLSQRCGVCIEIEPAAICWYQGGIVLRTTFCQIRYYQKDSSDFWRKVWFVKNTNWPCVLTSHPSRNDRLFFATREGHLMQIEMVEATKAVATLRYFNGGIYRFVDFVNPWGEHIVTIDTSMELSVIEARTGAKVTTIESDIEGKPTFMLSHHDYPIIVVSSDQGEAIFISLFNYQKPMILAKYKLQSEELDFMKFSSTGSYLIVGHKESGICYFLKISVGHKIDVITRFETGQRIADMLLFDVQDSLQLYILTKSSSIVPVGYKLLTYILPSGQHEFTKTPNVFYLNKFYQSLEYATRDAYTFIGTPYLTKQLRFYKITDWKSITCSDIVSSGHNLRCAKVVTDKKWLVTCGLDGSITVRDINVKNRKNLHFMTHHKCDFGVTKAVVNSAGDAVIALGADGSLVAVCRFKTEGFPTEDNRFKNLVEFVLVNLQENQIVDHEKMFDKPIVKFLSEPISTYASVEEYKNMTWVEWRERQRVEEERKNAQQEKEQIIAEFNVIKNRIVELLDKNERSFDYEKLSISKFALNKMYREKRMKTAKDEREDMSREIESDCEELNRISDWIQETYWDTQKVLAQSVFGIFDNTEVTNYTMCVEKLVTSDHFSYAQFARSVAKELMNKETVYPWEKSQDRMKKIKSIQLKNIDEEETIEQLIALDEEPEVDEEEERNKYLLEGLTTRHFIEPSGNYYSQFEIYSFSQISCDNYNIAEDCKQLRLFFNKRFSDIFSMKEREMTLVRERIDRVIHIGSELYTMFKELISENFVYPEWNQKEHPDSIIQVKDSELSSKPYISPSRQELLDRKAAEEERKKLAMLADDFYDRALQKMMDGKLEVRWEDIIKRDPPKPDCLLSGRDPESFSDEELSAIKRYEQEVKNLEAERERYRRLLHSDLVKTTKDLRESIDKFNSRLEDFYSLKMKVEAAIQQLNLRYVRYSVGHVNRVREIKADDDIKMKIEQSYQSISNILEEMKIIQAVEQQLHEKHDTLSVKDKHLEKILKSEFPTLNKNAFTAISMQFKKRPRLVLKTNSPAEVLDLAKSVTSMERLPYLTTECLDYLKQLEGLEIRSPNLPQSIEASHWQNLVVLRRLKIDHELKLHALSMELVLVAAALDECNRKLTEHRAAIDSMKRQLKDSRKERIEREINVELQLVLKMGQTEIATLRGDVENDWTNAVVVPRSDLDQVNEAVLRSGRKKIRTIEKSLQFGKSIEVERWGHQCLRTKVMHFSAELYFVKMANVTREIREFLRRAATGQKDDKTPQKMERELDLTRRGQEKILRDWEMKLEDVSVEVVRVRRKNKKLDKKVVRLNVDRCDMELKRDVKGEARYKNFREKVVKLAAERSAIVRKLLVDYEELLKLRQKRDSIVCVGKPLPIKSYDDES